VWVRSLQLNVFGENTLALRVVFSISVLMVLEICFVVVLAVAVAAVFWFMVRQSSEKIVRQYQKMALRLKVGLTEPEAQLAGFIRSEPFIHGIYRRREMSISTPGKGVQNTRQIETNLKVKVNEASFTWQMTATGLLGGFRQRDSGTKARWMSGDSSFDTVVDVRTNDDARFARIFHVDRRAVVAKILKDSKGTIALRGGVLSFAEFGLIADDLKRERFLEITELLCDIAEVVEGR
jgi:hypothetical protein